jgi:glycerol dehydrogenase-like iron-containing ADH family enzyme
MRDILGIGAGGSRAASGAEHLMDKQLAQATHLDTPQPLL